MKFLGLKKHSSSSQASSLHTILSVVRCLLVATVLLLSATSCQRGRYSGTFSVCTLNVDGLPDRVLMLDVNPEGPGEDFTPVISHYLATRGFDFIGVQENFHYDTQLRQFLMPDYDGDQWSGDIAPDPSMLSGIDLSMLLGNAVQALRQSNAQEMLAGLKLPADGLNAFWRKSDTLVRSERVAWNTAFGKLDHAMDDLATKGFRRYELKLSNGSEVVVYNMHTDASDTPDELSGADLPDRQARLAQWRQLRDHIMQHLDHRPVVVMGDLNSYYERDSVKAAFIDHINGTGRATCGDAWVELKMGGKYPQMHDGPVTADNDGDGWIRNNETLDKILYINPKNGHRLKPSAATLDRDGYRRPDGRPLGDHYPLAVSFRFVR